MQTTRHAIDRKTLLHIYTELNHKCQHESVKMMVPDFEVLSILNLLYCSARERGSKALLMKIIWMVRLFINSCLLSRSILYIYENNGKTGPAAQVCFKGSKRAGF